MHATLLDKRSLVGKQARDQLAGLALMFLLGMAVNLIGLPAEVNGGAKMATNIFLSLHVLIGIGLVAGSIMVVVRARSSAYTKQAWLGLAVIAFTFLCGGMTIATKSNWWSYAMSVGFIADFWVYGMLFIRTRAKNKNEGPY